MSWRTIVQEKGLAISSISLAQVLTLNRLDAEYFKPEYLEFEKLIDKKGYKEISRFATITDGIHASIEFDEDSNINLLSAMSPKENYFDISRNKTISKIQHTKNPRTELKLNDVIISTVGTIGNCAVVDNSVLPANCDRHVGIIRIKTDYSPHFISTFLLGRYGRFQTLREATGNVQLNLFIEKINTLKIPVASDRFQKSVSDTVIAGLSLRMKSQNEYSEAEQLLLKEINLEGYKTTNESVSIRNFSEALADNRFDAEYWQPKYDEIDKRASLIPQQALGEIVSVKKGVEVGSEAYSDEGRDFVRVSDFTIYGIENTEKKIPETLYEGLTENYRPKKGEILFTKDGTIGISYALNEDVNAILSGAFLRFKPKVKINTNYLALVLNSFYCKAQIERMSGGAIIAHLKPESALQIKIPILSESKQQELAGKVLDALRLRKEAKTLLEKAKRAVEIFVETDENTALTYLAG